MWVLTWRHYTRAARVVPVVIFLPAKCARVCRGTADLLRSSVLRHSTRVQNQWSSCSLPFLLAIRGKSNAECTEEGLQIPRCCLEACLAGIVDNLEFTTATVHQSLSISLVDLRHLIDGPVHIRAINGQLDHLPGVDLATLVHECVNHQAVEKYRCW